MRDALTGIIADYRGFVGNSKIVTLFLISMLALIFIDEKKLGKNNESIERRRLNPTVFLLSLWSMAAYVGVMLTASKKRIYLIAGMLFSIVAIVLSGNMVFSDTAYKASVYFYTDNKITALCIVCIFFYVLIYYLISRQLFSKRAERLQFMFYVILLHLFGFYSEASASCSLILSPVTVQSIIIHDVMPLLLWLYLMYQEQIDRWLKADNESDTDDSEEIPEEWDMKKHKILNIRNMAIAFIVLVIVFIASIFVLNKKINTLYDATVVLENAANSKMTVCELKDAKGNVSLTLMISPEGSATVIGGGDSTQGTECYDFIMKYADKVDKWYLYGEDEVSKGAYDFCIENGMQVDDAYVVSGLEKID